MKLGPATEWAELRSLASANTLHWLLQISGCGP